MDGSDRKSGWRSSDTGGKKALAEYSVNASFVALNPLLGEGERMR